jgi:hypothetical protein
LNAVKDVSTVMVYTGDYHCDVKKVAIYSGRRTATPKFRSSHFSNGWSLCIEEII